MFRGEGRRGEEGIGNTFDPRARRICVHAHVRLGVVPELELILGIQKVQTRHIAILGGTDPARAVGALEDKAFGPGIAGLVEGVFVDHAVLCARVET